METATTLTIMTLTLFADLWDGFFSQMPTISSVSLCWRTSSAEFTSRITHTTHRVLSTQENFQSTTTQQFQLLPYAAPYLARFYSAILLMCLVVDPSMACPLPSWSSRASPSRWLSDTLLMLWSEHFASGDFYWALESVVITHYQRPLCLSTPQPSLVVPTLDQYSPCRVSSA